jgi:amino acid adenylation domain-containing protein
LSQPAPGPLPLSEHQLALLRASEAGECYPARNAFARLACRLPLDPARLARAVASSAAALPSLRAAFDVRPGSAPACTIMEAAVPELVILDGIPQSGNGQRQTAEQALQAAAGRPFAVSRAPLARFVAYKDNGGFTLAAVTHPALLDRRSQRLLLAEILRRYQEKPGAAAADQAAAAAASVPGPGTSETAAAARERAAVFAGLTAAPAAFWIASAVGEKTSPPAPGCCCAGPLSAEVELPADLGGRLDALAGQLGIPAEDIALAAHAKAVAMATGKADVVIGLERRHDGQADPVPGMRCAVLPARITLRAGPWPALAEQAREAAGEAAAHPGLSPRRITRLLGTGRLLDSTFAYSDDALESDLLDAGRGSLGPLAGHPGDTEADTGCAHAPFDGTVLAEFFRGPATGRLRLRLTAGGGLAEDQLAHVARLHAAALEHCADGSEPHQSLPSLTLLQRELTMFRWNVDERDYDLSRPLHELIEDQVRRTPGAAAVTDSARTLTYAELNEQANRLARRLADQGAGPGSVVGISVRRDAGMLAAFLGVLKAGAAYLPLDLSQPAERTSYMLTTARAALVLADAAYAPAIPAGPWTVLRADDTTENARFGSTDLGPTSTGEDLMYVIYTSGSTGVPKGVEVPHLGVVNHLLFGVEEFAGNGDGGAPVFSSTAFDMVVPDLYLPLLLGQRVAMLEEDLDLFAVAARLRELAPFAFIKLTPGQLDTLSELLPPQDARRLAGRLVVGADAFTVRTLRRWRRLDDQTPILNDYGPTEASVANSEYHVTGAEDGELLPIGRPNPNTTMYVLDASGSPVPVGVPGDLFIGGIALARGYAGKPDLTRERFIPDPFSGRPGARMYRTGDIGRWLPGGILEFLGRADTQMKIRGYRVEPAEVEAAMTRHPAVTDAAVAAVGAARETQALAGYYVAGPGHPAPSPQEIQAFLSGILPDFLVPSFLLPIDRIPLTANGKVDRKALPAPGRRRAAAALQEQAAASTAGQAAARAWQAVFGGPAPSPGDPVSLADGDPAAEIQFAFSLAAADISTEQAFRAAAADTFGGVCEQLAQAAPPSGQDGQPQTPLAGRPAAAP